MNRLRLFSLLLVLLLLTGCWGMGPKRGPATMELQGELGLVAELWLTQDDRTFVVDMGPDKAKVLSLDPGFWWVQAFSRDAQGCVISLSEPTRVQGNREVVVSLVLAQTEQGTTPVRARKVAHSLVLAGGVELAWEGHEGDLESLNAGSWEIWKRHHTEAFWHRLETLPAGETSFLDGDHRAHEYRYALRFVASPEQGNFFPSPLQESLGSAVGVLDVTWSFEHYFPPVSYTLSFSSPDFIEDSLSEPMFSDLIAHFRTEGGFERRAELLTSLGLISKEEFPSLLAVLVEPPAHSPWSLEEWSLYQDEHLYLEPNRIWEVGGLGFSSDIVPWYLEYLRVHRAHAKTRGSHQVRISVLDTGLNATELPASVNVLPGYNFVGKNDDTQDDQVGTYHGTMVSRTISQVMPLVSLQPVKVLGSSGSGTDAVVSQGLLYAAGLHDHLVNPTPAHIINMSLGQSRDSSVLRKAVERIASETDVVLIGAAGNTLRGATSPGLFYPAALSQVVAVGAVVPGIHGLERANYSHFGQALDVVATESFFSGTSASTALVSGVAGLMLAQGVPSRDIPAILTETAMDIGVPGWDEEHGYGLVNAEWAVNEVRHLILLVTDTRGGWRLEELPLKGEATRFYLPPGEYTVEAWVKVTGESLPQVGDYYGRVQGIQIEDDQEVKVALTLAEKEF